MLGMVLSLYGLWTLIIGRLPAGKAYRIAGNRARLIGGLLVLTFPLQVLMEMILQFITRATLEPMYSVIVGFGIVVGMLVLTAIISRVVRTPVAKP